MDTKLQMLIHKFERPGDFTHTSISTSALELAEKELHITLPKQYVDFLTCYGHGGIGGVEVIGIGRTGKPLFVEETQKYREYGLPKNYLVIENCDEWVYCIDSTSQKVVSWSNGCTENCYQDFDAYLSDRFHDAVENL